MILTPNMRPFGLIQVHEILSYIYGNIDESDLHSTHILTYSSTFSGRLKGAFLESGTSEVKLNL